MQCQFERKYHRSYETATDADLEQFSYSYVHMFQMWLISTSKLTLLILRAVIIPSLSPPTPPIPSGRKQGKTSSATQFTPSSAEENGVTSVVEDGHAKTSNVRDAPSIKGERLAKERVELHLYDVNSGAFILQESDLISQVIDGGGWECMDPSSKSSY